MHSPALQRDLWVLSHPDHVRHVLVDHHANFRKGIGIERVAILLGNGLMTSEGEHWRRQRKMVQPAFHRKVIATSGWKAITHLSAAEGHLSPGAAGFLARGRKGNLYFYPVAGKKIQKRITVGVGGWDALKIGS